MGRSTGAVDTDLNRAAISTIIFFSPYCADCDIVKQVKRSAAGRQVEAWVCSRWSSNQSLFSTALESTVREASESMLFSTSSKASVCRLASLAPLPVLSRVLLNEDYFNSHLEHTQASTCLAAAERFICFTMSQSAQYGEKKMIVLIAARSGRSCAVSLARTALRKCSGGWACSRDEESGESDAATVCTSIVYNGRRRIGRETWAFNPVCFWSYSSRSRL